MPPRASSIRKIQILLVMITVVSTSLSVLFAALRSQALQDQVVILSGPTADPTDTPITPPTPSTLNCTHDLTQNPNAYTDEAVVISYLGEDPQSISLIEHRAYGNPEIANSMVGSMTTELNTVLAIYHDSGLSELNGSVVAENSLTIMNISAPGAVLTDENYATIFGLSSSKLSPAAAQETYEARGFVCTLENAQ